MVRRHLLLQLAGRFRIGGKRSDRVYPIERVQVIEMDEVIVHLQRELHDIADRIGVFRNFDLKRILDRAHRGERVRASAYAANSLGEGPSVARIAALQDHFKPAPHGTGRDRVADRVAVVDIDLAAHVAFDARDGIDDNALAAIVESKAVRRLNRHDWSPPLSRARLTAVIAACAAMPAPTTPTAAVPTWSAFASMPN